MGKITKTYTFCVLSNIFWAGEEALGEYELMALIYVKYWPCVVVLFFSYK